MELIETLTVSEPTASGESRTGSGPLEIRDGTRAGSVIGHPIAHSNVYVFRAADTNLRILMPDTVRIRIFPVLGERSRWMKAPRQRMPLPDISALLPSALKMTAEKSASG